MKAEYSVVLTASTSAELDQAIRDLASKLDNLGEVANTDMHDAQQALAGAPASTPSLGVPATQPNLPPLPPVPSVTPPRPTPPAPQGAPAQASTAKHTKKEVTDMGRELMAREDAALTKAVKDILRKHGVTGITTIPMELVETMFTEFSVLQAGADAGQEEAPSEPPVTQPQAPSAPPVPSAKPPVPSAPTPPTIVPPAPSANTLLQPSPQGTPIEYPHLLGIAQKTSALGGSEVAQEIMGVIQQTGVSGLTEVSPQWFEWLEYQLIELHNRLVTAKG